jgi:hypothetical protein
MPCHPETPEFVDHRMVPWTRTAYAYTDDNPENLVDPSGLYCVTGVANPNRPPGEEERCNGGSDVGDNVLPDPTDGFRTWPSEHFGASFDVCAIGCIGLTIQHGHVFFDRGWGAIGGGGLDLNYYSQPLDPNNCNRSQGGTAGENVGFQGSTGEDPATGQMDKDRFGQSFGMSTPVGIPTLWYGEMWQSSFFTLPWGLG